MRLSFISLLAGLALIVIGSFVASLVQSSGGTDVRDIRIPLEDGSELSAYLYVPENASEASPAPGILAVHGYINSRETQSSFAIEFARRGYVVLALDQSGHGYSTNTAFADGFGGPAGLQYLRSLPFVDPDQIGLEGHSMGGWTSLNAAMAMPDAYQSIALVGSSTGAPFAAPGTETFPRNLGVIFSTYDEFAQLMWSVERAADVKDGEKLQAAFGTEETIRAGDVYGSIEDGTARWLAQPVTTHPGDHLSFAATADALTWMDMTIGAPKAIAVDKQIWHFKEFGTFIALVGAVAFLIGLFAVLSAAFTPATAATSETDVREERLTSGLPFYIALVLGILIPALTFFPFTALGEQIPSFGIFRQNITNQIMAWAVGNAIIAGIGLAIARQFNLRISAAGIGAAAVSVLALYFVSVAVSDLLHVDFRFWVVALKPLGLHHWPIFLTYLLPFLLFFLLSHMAIRQLTAGMTSVKKQFGVTWLMSAGGITALIVVVYIGLFTMGRLPAFADPLFSIVGIQFIPILTITAIMAVVSLRTTRAVIPGALLSALFVTWYIVAGQATHV